VLFGFLVALIVGCGSSGGYTVAPVSGVVTLDSKPLPGVTLVFQPVSAKAGTNPGPGSVGVTGSDGRYTLQTIEPRGKGAVVGKHNVSLSTAEADPNDDRATSGSRELIPVGERKRTFEVPAGGTDKADFALSSK